MQTIWGDDLNHVHQDVQLDLLFDKVGDIKSKMMCLHTYVCMKILQMSLIIGLLGVAEQRRKIRQTVKILSIEHAIIFLWK